VFCPDGDITDPTIHPRIRHGRGTADGNNGDVVIARIAHDIAVYRLRMGASPYAATDIDRIDIKDVIRNAKQD
jgi:hypothetical protein